MNELPGYSEEGTQELRQWLRDYASGWGACVPFCGDWREHAAAIAAAKECADRESYVAKHADGSPAVNDWPEHGLAWYTHYNHFTPFTESAPEKDDR